MKEQTKSVSKETKRRPVIAASDELWAKFDIFMKRQGCTSLAEGIRTAMKIVTNFNGDGQVKNPSAA